MKVVVTDKLAAAATEWLQTQSDVTTVVIPTLPPEELKPILADANALIVRSATQVDADLITSAPQLRAIGRAGVGVDNIDVDTATARGIVVMNTPGGNTISTAELAFTHLLASARPIAQANASMTAGNWEKKAFAGTEVNGKTLGILGLGRIGSEVAHRAKAFGMSVLAYDPYLTADRAQALEVKQATLDELFSSSDFITVHMPKTQQTTHMIDAAAIARMKPGTRIINCARGGLIDEAALAEALQSGHLAAAGLDVFEEEPLAADSPLRTMPNLVLTPHLGASTIEAQENVGIQVAQQIAEYLRHGIPRNALNMPSVDPATLKVLRPYLTLGERLGTMLQQITPDVLKSIKITYSGRITELEVLPLTRSIQRGYLRRIAENVNDVNAPLALKRKGIAVDVMKTSEEREYTDLVRVEAQDSKGHHYSIEGTLLGKAQRPRLVHLNGRQVEITLAGHILVIENKDVRGVVGTVGTILAKYAVNIANMALSRSAIGGTAFTLIELDELPNRECLDEILDQTEIVQAYTVAL